VSDWYGLFSLDTTGVYIMRIFIFMILVEYGYLRIFFGPGIRGTQVKSSVRMKKMQESSKCLFLGNLIPEIESKAPN